MIEYIKSAQLAKNELFFVWKLSRIKTQRGKNSI